MYDFSICKVKDFSQCDFNKPFCFAEKTDEENSPVCLTENIPKNTTDRNDGWKAFRVEGTLDFSLIGILSKLTAVLAENKISVFAVSTFNTDYIFTRTENFECALTAFEKSGCKIVK